MTAAELARKYNVRASLVTTEFRKTLRGIGQAAVSYTKERLTTEVYAIPEDVTKNGKKKWKRTGRLRRGERFEIRSPYEVAILNDTPYAHPRHEAGLPGHRKINPLRESHWRDDLLEKFRPFLLEAYELTLRDILARGSR